MSFIVGTLLLAVVTASACAVPGVFVVLRKHSMLIDAIGHAILPGIALGYLFTNNLNSPVVIVCAALAGVLVVLGAQWLGDSGLVIGDAPQGLIFPALFSVGVILITSHFSNVHLDTHAVLVGDLNLAAWHQLSLGGVQIGPVHLYIMLAVLVLNVAVIGLFYPQLLASTFDGQFARSIGVPVGMLSIAFMFLVSLTVTAAFNAVGAILVIALVVIPAAAAKQLATTVPRMMALTVLLAAVGAVAGFGVAYLLDAPTSATMTVIYGLEFLSCALWARWTRQTRRSPTRRPLRVSRAQVEVAGRR